MKPLTGEEVNASTPHTVDAYLWPLLVVDGRMQVLPSAPTTKPSLQRWTTHEPLLHETSRVFGIAEQSCLREVQGPVQERWSVQRKTSTARVDNRTGDG
jgi:hypothetical protein